jgi:tetratricopeptide (TPR) repeat protein
MAVARAIKGVVLIAFVVTFAALYVATRAPRFANRAVVTPEAWKALERQDAERAAALFDQALKERPNDPVLHLGVGSAAYALGRTDAALRALQKAVALDPDFAEAQAMLGQVAYARGDSALAIRAMEKAAAIRPGDSEVEEALERWRHEAAVHGEYLERPSEHFRVLYEGATQQAIGDRVLRTLEREHARIGRALNVSLPETLTVVLYTDRDFQDITRSPAWASGKYDGRIRLTVGGTIPSGELERVATHELVHAFVAAAAPRRVPAWLNEGLASYLESANHAWAPAVIRQANASVPLESLIDGFSGLDARQAQVAYAESAIAAEILCDLLGTNVGAFLKAVGNGATVDQAFLEFHLQPNGFHSEWRRRVGLQ